MTKFLLAILVSIVSFSATAQYRIGTDQLRLGKTGSEADVSVEAQGSAMKLIFNKTDGKIQYTFNGISISDLGTASSPTLTKADSESPAFTKTAAGTISVKGGTSILVNGTNVSFASDTPVVMPTLTAGTDYAIYFCDDSTARASDNWSNPSGYAEGDCKKTGGFHHGLVSPTETVAGGTFATTGSGMIWTQADVDKIKGINQFSIWDLKFRPKTQDPRGMALVANEFWVDIYFTNTNHEVNGTSKAGTDVASGTVLPKKPTMFGGNGTATYSTGTWWNFSDIAKAHGKRLLSFQEFPAAAFGVTEAQSLGGSSVTIPTTTRQAGYTSKWGIEQATGHIWTWGADISGATGSSSYTANTDGRGSTYAANLSAPLYGGSRSHAADSGSRASIWNNPPTVSSWSIGLRAACDHLKLP